MHDGPKGIVFDGKLWPLTFSPDIFSSAKSMKPRPDDVFVCTYPKSGTTWVQHIVHQLLGKNGYEASGDEIKSTIKDVSKSMFISSPFIEMAGADYSDALDSPRILKSHLSYADIPKGGRAKYIFVCRNPKDCLTSYFHHHKNIKIFDFENGKFDVFFDMFMGGRVAYGDYFAHLNSWLEGIEKREEQILFIKYEDMLADLKSAVVEIATFLGGKAADSVRNEQQLARIVDSSTLASMKKNQKRWIPDKMQRGEFIRKGGSRDWKNYFSQEQSERMDACFRQRCAKLAAAEWWKSEMQWNEDTKSRLGPIIAADTSLISKL